MKITDTERKLIESSNDMRDKLRQFGAFSAHASGWLAVFRLYMREELDVVVDSENSFKLLDQKFVIEVEPDYAEILSGALVVYHILYDINKKAKAKTEILRLRVFDLSRFDNYGDSLACQMVIGAITQYFDTYDKGKGARSAGPPSH